jgi:transposase
MKQYTDEILPHYIEAVRNHQIRYGRGILQEDNDPSHGTRTAVNYAREAKKKANIETLWHPAQSPDLNASEGIWNIIKQRMRSIPWTSQEQLKQLAQDTWRGIDQDSIRARISDIPDRCELLADGNGSRLRNKLW